MNNLLSLKFLPKKLPNNSFSLSRHFHSSSSKIITPNKPTNTTDSHFLSPLQQWRSSSNSGLLSLLSNHAIPKYSASSSAAHFKSPTKSFLGSPLRFLTTRCSKVNKATTEEVTSSLSLKEIRAHFSRLMNEWFNRKGDAVNKLLVSLISANVAVFIMWQVLPQEIMHEHFTMSQDNYQRAFHQMITSAFSHFDVMHLVSNMLCLYVFGTSIGREFGPRVGPKFLLAVYGMGAFFGSLFYGQPSEEEIRRCRQLAEPLLGANAVVYSLFIIDLFYTWGKKFDLFIQVPTMLLASRMVREDFLRISRQEDYCSAVHMVAACLIIFPAVYF